MLLKLLHSCNLCGKTISAALLSKMLLCPTVTNSEVQPSAPLVEMQGNYPSHTRNVIMIIKTLQSSPTFTGVHKTSKVFFTSLVVYWFFYTNSSLFAIIQQLLFAS